MIPEMIGMFKLPGLLPLPTIICLLFQLLEAFLEQRREIQRLRKEMVDKDRLIATLEKDIHIYEPWRWVLLLAHSLIHQMNCAEGSRALYQVIPSRFPRFCEVLFEIIFPFPFFSFSSPTSPLRLDLNLYSVDFYFHSSFGFPSFSSVTILTCRSISWGGED